MREIVKRLKLKKKVFTFKENDTKGCCDIQVLLSFLPFLFHSSSYFLNFLLS